MCNYTESLKYNINLFKGAVSFNANGNRLNPLVLLLQFRMDASEF